MGGECPLHSNWFKREAWAEGSLPKKGIQSVLWLCQGLTMDIIIVYVFRILSISGHQGRT